MNSIQPIFARLFPFSVTLIIFLFLIFIPVIKSESLASFPDNIEKLVLVKESLIPGNDVLLPPETPLFSQETVRMYNWINNGQGTKLNIFIPKEKLEEYKQHGPYSDGLTAVAIFEDQDIVFVTEHIAGQAIYGTYDRDGKDISQTHPSLHIQTCYQCHEGHADVCQNGTCAVPIIDLFKKNNLR